MSRQYLAGVVGSTSKRVRDMSMVPVLSLKAP
jgi:hypothetical protein